MNPTYFLPTAVLLGLLGACSYDTQVPQEHLMNKQTPLENESPEVRTLIASSSECNPRVKVCDES